MSIYMFYYPLLMSFIFRATLYVHTVEYWKTVLRNDEPLPEASQTIYFHALHMVPSHTLPPLFYSFLHILFIYCSSFVDFVSQGRLAAVDEAFKDYAKSEEVYYTAMLLLESLVSDDIDPYPFLCPLSLSLSPFSPPFLLLVSLRSSPPL